MAITIPSEVKRDVLLRSAMRAFKHRILPIMAFARKFESIPLEGTNKVRVPYLPLATGATTTFNPANGYDTMNDQALQTREVTIDKRRYRGVSFTSEEWNRQPFLSQEEFIMLEAEKLADDVLTDIFSVITAANYGAPIISALAASAFDVDELLAIRRLLGEANWPSSPRSFVMDATFYENLLKDSRVHLQNYGSSDAVREGEVQRVAGFRLHEVPLMPANAEKLAAFAVYPSAIAVGFSPIRPHPVLTQTVLQYEVVSDPATGLALEYRRFADAKMDRVSEVIECNYGFNVLEAAALKRVVIP